MEIKLQALQKQMTKQAIFSPEPQKKTQNKEKHGNCLLRRLKLKIMNFIPSAN